MSEGGAIPPPVPINNKKLESMKKTVSKITDLEIRDNLIKWFNERTIEEHAAGLFWYAEAQQFTHELANDYILDPYKVAGVISALSPNNKWERNKIDAEIVIKAHLAGIGPESVKVCTYNSNKNKAFEILRGNAEITAKSPKTHAFAMNVGLNSPDHITVDKWHLRACVAGPNDGITDCAESCTAIQYRRVEAITAGIAKDLGLKGFELQAIIWVTIKRVWNR
jgi:hypothetical protein